MHTKLNYYFFNANLLLSMLYVYNVTGRFFFACPAHATKKLVRTWNIFAQASGFIAGNGRIILYEIGAYVTKEVDKGRNNTHFMRLKLIHRSIPLPYPFSSFLVYKSHKNVRIYRLTILSILIELSSSALDGPQSLDTITVYVISYGSLICCRNGVKSGICQANTFFPTVLSYRLLAVRL